MEMGELTIVATDDVPAEALNPVASELSGAVHVNEVQRIGQLGVLPPSWVQFVLDQTSWIIVARGTWVLAKGVDAFVKGLGEQLGKNVADKLSKVHRGSEAYDEVQAERAVERLIDALVRLKNRVPERTGVAAGLSLPNGERVALQLEGTDRSAIALRLAQFAALVPAIQKTVQSEAEAGREIEDPVLVLGSDGSVVMKWRDPETGNIREAML